MLYKASLLGLFSFLVLCVGCQNQRLIVETRYLGRNTLASTVVGTPDPRQRCPTTGQELYVTWRLPEEFASYDNLYLLMTLRYGNREENCVRIPVNRFRGCYVYCLCDNEYWDVCGILTYKVDLYSGECLLDTWHHQVWSELINFDECENGRVLLDKGPWQM
jgi:hypothetical protein